MNEFKKIMKQLEKGESEVILDYADENWDDGWLVVQDVKTHEYTYVNFDEDEPEVYQVKLIASLAYDILHDVNDDGSTLEGLFSNCCCGEQVTDDEIRYLWFDYEEEDNE